MVKEIDTGEHHSLKSNLGVSIKGPIDPGSYSDMKTLLNATRQVMYYCIDFSQNDCPENCPVRELAGTAAKNLKEVSRKTSY